jgi:RNA polymerase sigma factor (sigma-70 family)
MQLTDSDLVRRAKAGELEAFEQLAARYEQKVYSLARRIVQQPEDAEDVTQQTFLSAVEHLDGFREEASFSTWLLRVATHAALKVIRKRRGLPMVSLEANTEPQEGYDTIPHPGIHRGLAGIAGATGRAARDGTADRCGAGRAGREASGDLFAARCGGVVREGDGGSAGTLGSEREGAFAAGTAPIARAIDRGFWRSSATPGTASSRGGSTSGSLVTI